MIPFNRPYMTGNELAYIEQAHANGHLAGDGPFTRRCHAWLERKIGCRKALLTHSCTAALEMAALLVDVGPGDEVIMPAYTFVSTANAFALRGAVPVFVDIRADTLNLDETLLEAAITPRTRAICVVHYAGVACEMDTIMAIAERHGLVVIEDAAQGVMSDYRGRPLGGIGQIGALSFHETKNIISGEGGALLLNDPRFVERAEIIREKGTDRSKFFRGLVDKYSWVDVGSSFLPGEIVAAFLYAQMEKAGEITARRVALWDRYHNWAEVREKRGLLRRPRIPAGCSNNAHMYYLLLPTPAARDDLLQRLKGDGIGAVFHYVPLHDTPHGRRAARAAGPLPNTVNLSARLLRMPLWLGLEPLMDEMLTRLDRHLEAACTA